MAIFDKISVGVKTKKYTHHIPFDNNTTMQFGVIQPLFHQFLNANDRLSSDVRQLVRLAPLPVPTFGRMHLENNFKFVKMSDIFPAYEAYLSHKFVNSSHSQYIPTELPFVTPALLCLWLLKYSVYATYKRNSDGNYAITTLPSDVQTLTSTLFDPHTGKVSYNMQNFFTAQALANVSPDGADYIIYSSDEKYIYCFRFTNAARRLRSILLGLGYTYDLDVTDKLDATPLLAFYKAYYDTYAPSRESSWTQTACFRLVNFIYDYNAPSIANFFADSLSGIYTDSIRKSAFQFLDDLLNCWYVEPLNYVSAHRLHTASNYAAEAYDPNQLDTSDVFQPALDYDSADHALPRLNEETSIAIRQVLKLSRFITKDSVIGQKVSTWLKAHFGANVDSSIFKDATNIATTRVNCSINDVFSTSDTLSDSGGETLGAYAGKGLGFDNSGFEFTAPSFGYVICLSCIVPDANFFQGYDPTLSAVSPDQRPNADLDAFGYEATPLASIAPLNDVSLSQRAVNINNKSFGFVPRYSSFKTRKDIINGDMSRRGSINGYAPYYLDKILTSQLVDATEVSQGVYTIIDRSSALPLATESWRYTCRFPWLGNFNRIFSSNNYAPYSLVEDKDTDNYYTEQIIDDLFIVQSVFDMRLVNCLKPMSESYDTFDDDVNGDNERIDQVAN